MDLLIDTVTNRFRLRSVLDDRETKLPKWMDQPPFLSPNKTLSTFADLPSFSKTISSFQQSLNFTSDLYIATNTDLTPQPQDANIPKYQLWFKNIHDAFPNHETLKTVILNVVQNLEPGLTKEEIVADIANDVPTELYLHQSIPLSHNLYNVMRKMLTDMGFQVERRKGLSIAKATSDILYAGGTESLRDSIRRIDHNRNKPAAMQVSSSSNEHPAHAATATSGSHSNIGCNIQAIPQAFPVGTRFTGDIHEKIQFSEVKRTFLSNLDAQGIPHGHQVPILHYCLDGPAKDFYYDKIRGQVTQLGEAFDLVDRKFNTPLTMLRKKNYVNNLTFRSIKEEEKCSDIEAYHKLRKRIKKITPQSARVWNLEMTQIDLLYRATLSEAWAQSALAIRMAHAENTGQDYSFDQYDAQIITLLTTASVNRTSTPIPDQPNYLQVPNGLLSLPDPSMATFLTTNPHTERTPAYEYREQFRGPPSTAFTHTPEHSTAFYGSTYANPRGNSTNRNPQKHSKSALDVAAILRGTAPTQAMNRAKKKLKSSQLAELKKRTRCLNCGKRGHWRRECPENNKPDTHPASSLMKQLHYRADAAEVVLFVMAQDDDEYQCYITQTSCNIPDDGDIISPTQTSTNTFQQLLATVSDDQDNAFSTSDAEAKATAMFNGFLSIHETASTPSGDQIFLEE